MGKIKNFEETYKKFRQAEYTFKYQIIYDVINKKEKHLNDIPKDFKDDLKFLGEIKNDFIAS